MLLWFSNAAAAQTIPTSPGPDSVDVTVYRDPNRAAGEPLNLNWLNGFALISETRTITIPAGESDMRFEGVAGGIIPESAIVTDLPAGVIEKNQDAWLLSPASLLDASLGRRVHIRRTSLATGEVTETDAVVRSGAEGAVVLETQAGIEALRCTGLPETLIYDRVPEGLSAKPTLSVRLRAQRETRAQVTLSYLATGFDWQANYVAELSEDGEQMDLFAWLTLANGDETGFVRADTQAIAGRLNREGVVRLPEPNPRLELRCWPQGTTTSDLRQLLPPPPAPPPPPPVAMSDIVVTGARVAAPEMQSTLAVAMVAEEEELGDLRLYRIPEPVSVAARSQKQVALLERDSVPIEIVYRHRGGAGFSGGAIPVVTARNIDRERLGLALPAGQIAFFEEHEGRRLFAGRGQMRDIAVGEEVEIELGRATAVQVQELVLERGEGRGAYRLTVTNAKPYPVRFEAEIGGPGTEIETDARLARRDGRPLWAVTVPANGSATISYRLTAR